MNKKRGERTGTETPPVRYSTLKPRAENGDERLKGRGTGDEKPEVEPVNGRAEEKGGSRSVMRQGITQASWKPENFGK